MHFNSVVTNNAFAILRRGESFEELEQALRLGSKNSAPYVFRKGWYDPFHSTDCVSFP